MGLMSEIIGAAESTNSKEFKEAGGPWKFYFYACCDILDDIHFCHLLIYNSKDEYVDLESLPLAIQESTKGLTQMLKHKVYMKNKEAMQERLYPKDN